MAGIVEQIVSPEQGLYIRSGNGQSLVMVPEEIKQVFDANGLDATEAWIKEQIATVFELDQSTIIVTLSPDGLLQNIAYHDLPLV